MNRNSPYITEDFVKLIITSNNNGDNTNNRIKSYFNSTFEIDSLLERVWRSVKSYRDMTRVDFRYLLVCKALNIQPDDTKEFNLSISDNDAAIYIFYSLYPILEATYNSYIVRNKYTYDKLEKQNINFYEYMDEAFILLKTEILVASKFDRILEGGKSKIMDNLKSMFSARIVNLVQSMKRDEVTHGLTDFGSVDSEFKKTINATENDLNNIEYYDNTKDHSDFLEKWNNCCNDTKYRFNRWSLIKKLADGTEKPNRKAKVLKYLVINALKSGGSTRAKDVYDALYSDTTNPKQKWDGEISGTLANGNKELSMVGILKDYNITINEIIEACKDLGVNEVLGKLKGMGSQLPDSNLKDYATSLGKDIANGNDILNEHKI